MITSSSPTDRFNLLTKMPGRPGENLGGSLALPDEFDTSKFAAQWTLEAEVEAKMQTQRIHGTSYSAPGWAKWLYPRMIKTGKKIERTLSKKEKEEGVQAEMIDEEIPHPKAGQHCKVSLTGKEAGAVILMFRDATVQRQVNEVYADQSRTLINEGRFAIPPNVEQEGLISEEQLVHMGIRDSEVDHEPVATSVLSGALSSGGGNISQVPIKLQQ